MTKISVKKINVKNLSVKKIAVAGAVVALLIISAFHHCGESKTLVVDFQRLWREVKVYQSISENYTAYQQGLKIKFNEGVLALQKQNQELLADKKKLGEAEFKKKTAALEQQARAMDQEYVALSKKGTAETDQVLNQLKPQVDEVLREVAKSEGAGILFNKALALYADDAQDITDEVIKALNKKLSPVNVAAPVKNEKENKNG